MTGNLVEVKLAFPEPPLRSAQIVLRRLSASDAPAIAEACRDAAITRFTFMPEGLDGDDAGGWIDAKNGRWGSDCSFAIADSRSDELVGHAGMAHYERFQTGEVYYWVLPTARGRGVASTAVGLICDWAFAHQLERLFLLTHPENDASHGVAARCGFTREGILRAYERIKDRRPDLVSWSLLPDDERPWHRP